MYNYTYLKVFIADYNANHAEEQGKGELKVIPYRLEESGKKGTRYSVRMFVYFGETEEKQFIGEGYDFSNIEHRLANDVVNYLKTTYLL